MKKFFAIMLITIMPLSSFAGWMDSFWFEPSLFCAVGAGAGYSGATDGNKNNGAALGCLAGGLIGYLINDHYQDKFTKNSQKEIDDLNRVIQEIQAQQAQKAINGEDESVSLRIKQVIPGKRLPDGSVTAPTYREKLILPGEGVRIGE